MSRTSRKWLAVLGGPAACVVVLLGIVVIKAGFTSAPPAPLPKPNGYDDFLKAVSLVTGDWGNSAILEPDELRDLIATNAESLRLVRLGLTRQCAFPAERGMANVPGMMNELAGLKRLAQLLAAEGRWQESENKLDDAAGNYVDIIHFGNEISRGGFIINRLVGLACEAIGESSLSRLVPKLNPEQSRRVVAQLESLDSAQVTWAEVSKNERRFARYQFRNGFNPLAWIISRIQSRRSIVQAQVRDQRVVAHLRLITTELALRCYQANQGTVPGSLEQLVPKYLRQVPADPFTGKPLIYHPQTSNWLLYSVGEDQVDDGGQPVGRGLGSKGDIRYDSRW